MAQGPCSWMELQISYPREDTDTANDLKTESKHNLNPTPPKSGDRRGLIRKEPVHSGRPIMAKHRRSRESGEASSKPPPQDTQPTSSTPQVSTSHNTPGQREELGRRNLASRSFEIEMRRPPPIRMSPDGLLEEQPSNWAKSKSTPHEDDPRTLAELAEDVMRAAAEASTTNESLRPDEVADGESKPAEQRSSEPTDDQIEGDAAVADAPQLPADRSRNRWAAPIVVLILLFAAGGGLLWFDTSIVGSGADSGVDGGSAATTGDTAASGAAMTGTPSEDEASPVAAKEPVPTPKSTPAPQHTPIPAPDSESLDDPVSEPSTEPAAVPTPRPTPVPTLTIIPEPGGAHVADLAASTKKIGKRVKVSVEVHVHDSAHNPVADATVSGQWTGDIGSVSCVTGRTGSCAAQTDPLASPGSVTFTVAGIADAGEPYEPIMNHDLNGDSNGTSVTVGF